MVKTVEEVIAELQAMPPKAELWVSGPEGVWVPIVVKLNNHNVLIKRDAESWAGPLGT